MEKIEEVEKVTEEKYPKPTYSKKKKVEVEEKELLDYLDGVCVFLAAHHHTDEDVRMVAIRDLIKKSFNEKEEDKRL